MGHTPTLGGIKVLQAYLSAFGFDLSVFQRDCYDGEFISDLDQQIALFGANATVLNVCIRNEDGSRCVRFSELSRLGPGGAEMHRLHGFSCAFTFDADETEDPEFFRECENAYKCGLQNLARWGLVDPTIWNRFQFAFFPARYVQRVFDVAA